MSSAKLIPEFEALTLEEKIEFVQELWDRIGESSDAAYLTEQQRQELDRRLEAYRENPDDVVSWDEVQARLRGND